MIKVFSITLFLSCLPVKSFAQNFPKDTSYTIYSTYNKLIEEFPFIKIPHLKLSKKVIKKENIIYVSHLNRNLHLDLFRPSSDREPFPVVLIIHGGGWKSGTKEMNHPFAVKLAENNYAAITVEYRLSPEEKYPAAINDLKKAIEWIYNNAVEYNFDTTKISLLGFSAGGTLASLIGTINCNAKLKTGNKSIFFSKEVHSIVNIDGILDFTDPAESGKDNDPLKPSAGKLWFGDSYKDNPEIWREASPLNYVNEKTPPIAFINSSRERFHAGRDEMIEFLKSHNIYYEVHTLTGTPHSFWLFHPWFEQTIYYTTNFLNNIFKKE